jgi:hypothetical protein
MSWKMTEISTNGNVLIELVKTRLKDQLIEKINQSKIFQSKDQLIKRSKTYYYNVIQQVKTQLKDQKCTNTI